MSTEEREQVLEMLSEGKISVEEAELLLDALESTVMDETAVYEPFPTKFKKTNNYDTILNTEQLMILSRENVTPDFLRAVKQLGHLEGLTGDHIVQMGVAGVTPGKGLMGVRVIRRDGEGLSFLRSLLRLFGYWVSTLLSGLGYLWIAIDNRREAWHDKIARTAVIYAWDAHPSTRSLGNIMRAAGDTEENPPPED